jgi:hypothetical protein
MDNYNQPQLGELPGYDKDLGTDGAKFTKGIRRKVLLGEYEAGDATEERMIREFKASKLGVNKFLATWKR